MSDDVAKGFRRIGHVTTSGYLHLDAHVKNDDVVFFSWHPSGEKMRATPVLRVRQARGYYLLDVTGVATWDYVFVATAIGEDAFRTGRFA